MLMLNPHVNKTLTYKYCNNIKKKLCKKYSVEQFNLNLYWHYLKRIKIVLNLYFVRYQMGTWRDMCKCWMYSKEIDAQSSSIGRVCP
jgi:hypothetical protein